MGILVLAILFHAYVLATRSYSSFKDPYSVLGVQNSASGSEIKRAYFDLVKKYHPDTNKDPEAKTKFIEIQNAYEILSDPKRKSTFDQYGATEEQASQGPEASGFGAGAAGFDPAEMFRNIFTGGFNTTNDFFGNLNQSDLDIEVS
ncbi:putative chaperone protein dnaj protein [Paramicrosporidium saccamoebae]|uniref:Putative chaperone protein dnaj protein n=1 Tax=Paramicrosporidium saccamoebae TaxID=1246581 RepID=A0A2H9TIJ2_9FUNG|nr:putative chaperone protein dnaj protein [Paramicrosporidium saccamoebae]